MFFLILCAHASFAEQEKDFWNELIKMADEPFTHSNQQNHFDELLCSLEASDDFTNASPVSEVPFVMYLDIIDASCNRLMLDMYLVIVSTKGWLEPFILMYSKSCSAEYM